MTRQKPLRLPPFAVYHLSQEKDFEWLVMELGQYEKRGKPNEVLIEPEQVGLPLLIWGGESSRTQEGAKLPDFYSDTLEAFLDAFLAEAVRWGYEQEDFYKWVGAGIAAVGGDTNLAAAVMWCVNGEPWTVDEIVNVEAWAVDEGESVLRKPRPGEFAFFFKLDWKGFYRVSEALIMRALGKLSGWPFAYIDDSADWRKETQSLLRKAQGEIEIGWALSELEAPPAPPKQGRAAPDGPPDASTGMMETLFPERAERAGREAAKKHEEEWERVHGVRYPKSDADFYELMGLAGLPSVKGESGEATWARIEKRLRTLKAMDAIGKVFARYNEGREQAAAIESQFAEAIEIARNAENAGGAGGGAEEEEATEQPKGKPSRRPVKEPTKDEIAVYRVWFAVHSGYLDSVDKTQAAIAVVAAQRLQKTINQSKVSRCVAKVKAWIEAGNVLPGLDGKPANKPISVDPSLLELGPRQDRGRTREEDEDEEN